MAVLLHDLGYNVSGHWPTYKTNPGLSIFYPTAWRKDDQRFDLRPSRSRKASTVGIHFLNARWDSQASDIAYGEETLDHKAIESDEGKTKIIKNGTDGTLHISYEEQVGLTDSFSSHVTKGVVLDMTKTKDASVDVGTKISGEYPGVKAEVSLAAHMGVSESKSESRSSELGKERAEEGTKNESLAIEFDARPSSNYLVQITKENEQTRQPFDINGVLDPDMRIIPKDEYWQPAPGQKHRPRGEIRLVGVGGLMQFVAGFDTDYPSMEGYFARAPQHVKDAMDWIQNPESRRIQVSGIDLASLDRNADYEVKMLGSAIPLGLGHLPVVDAQDVAI